MTMSKEWTWTLEQPGRGKPWNLLPAYARNFIPVDAGSLNSAVSDPINSTILGFLQDETRTINAVHCTCIDASVATAKDYMAVESRPSGLMYCHGGVVQYNSSRLPYRHALYGPWHLATRLAGLYVIGVSSPTSTVLDSAATLIDADCTTGIVVTTSSGYTIIGIQVGNHVNNITYAPKVDALVLWGTACPADNIIGIYGSNDNANWTPIVRSALTGGGYSNGVATISNGTPFGGNGKVYLFGSPENYAYYSVAIHNTLSSSISIAEIAALSKFGDLSLTNDFANYKGLSPDNIPAYSGSGASLVTGTVSQYRYTFPSNSTIVAMRLLWDAIRLTTASVDPFDDGVDLAHLELYNNPNLLDFNDGTNAVTSVEITAQPGYTSDAITRYFVNHATIPTKTIQAWLPIDPQQVTTESLTEDVFTFYLHHNSVNLAKVPYILNFLGTGIGSFGDSSVTFTGAMAAWTEVAAAPGVAEYMIDYASGLVTTGSMVPLGSYATFKYAGLGSQVTEISEDGNTWVAIGSTLTFSNSAIAANETLVHYLRSNLSGKTEDQWKRAMPTKIMWHVDY